MAKSYKDFVLEIKINLPYNETLNPKLFENNQLKDKVRKILLDSAEKFRIGCKVISSDMVDDIVMTGGNANFNYSDLSDIDVHLIVDLNKIDTNIKLVQRYFKAEKDLWTLQHQVTVEGYPIEMYVQNSNETAPQGQGLYSLKNNRWLIEPTNLHLNLEDNPLLQKKVDYFADLIISLIKKKEYDKLLILKKKIKKLREEGLTKGGEFSNGNLVFKSLRNAGLLDQMNDFLNNKLEQDLEKGNR